MKKKIYSIEFIRFLLSVIIIYYHVLHSNIIPYTSGQKKYIILQNWSAYAGLGVECFLIIGGYFLYKSYKKNEEKSVLQFAIDRFFRLWPAYAVYTVLSMVFMGQTIYSGIYDLFMLRATGISQEYKGIVWFIGPFYWCSVFLYALFKSLPEKSKGLVLSLMVYFCYVINFNYLHGGVGREVIWNFLSLAMLRVFGGLALGGIIAMFLENLEKYIKETSKSFGYYVIISVIEVGTFLFLLSYFLTGIKKDKSVLIVIIAFLILFISMLKGNGVLTKVLNFSILGNLGKYSYSMYVFQQFSFFILKKTLWKYETFLYEHTLWATALSTLCSVGIGILFYYLVEAPCAKWYHKKKNQ